MSIIETLITDRTQRDVDRVNDLNTKGWLGMTDAEREEWSGGLKGSYNALDLNRVTSAMEYLVDRLKGFGYEVEYINPKEKRVVTLVNLIPNSSFETDSDWTGIVYDGTESLYGSRSSKLEGTTVSQVPLPLPIVGHKYYGRTYIKSSGNIGAADNRFEYFAGDGPGLNWVFARNDGNFPDWTMQSSIHTIDAVNGSEYFCRNFVVSAQNPCWTDGLMIIDLTVSFGTGMEPDKAWCDENIPYFDGSLEYETGEWWAISDIPTVEQMNIYLSDVQAIRDVLDVDQALPESMKKLTYEGANEIERALVLVEQTINQVVKAIPRLATHTFWSGNRPLPSAESDLGHTWDDLDAMNLTWDDLDAAGSDWYLIMYGVLR